MWTANKTAQVTGGEIVGDPRKKASGISTDSRSLTRNQGFVALRGSNFDGHQFVKAAAEKGAAWALVDLDYRLEAGLGLSLIRVKDTLAALGDLAREHRRGFNVKVAAITGSVGKSTTKEMTAKILARKGKVLKNRGNFNNLVGLPLTLLRLDRSHPFAALEMGCNAPGEIARLTGIAEPDAGAITRVAPAHLEGLGSLQGVCDAKCELVESLSKDACFVLNLDDPLLTKRLSRRARGLIGFSLKRNVSFAGESIHLVSLEKEVVASGPRLRFVAERRVNGKRAGKTVEFLIPGLSANIAQNALCAAALGRAFGVSLADSATALLNFRGLSGRGEVTRASSGVFVMNDTYNASPVSVVEALDTMAWWRGPLRGVAVLGEMRELGKESPRYHREIGRRVADSGVGLLIASGEHGRAVAEEAVAAGLPAENARVVRDAEEAARVLKRLMRKGDWILVKGSRLMSMEKVVEALLGK